MKVKQLIRELKQMPQNLDVEVAMNDNAEYETAGNVCSVFHFIKEEYDEDFIYSADQRAFDDMLNECVIIRC